MPLAQGGDYVSDAPTHKLRYTGFEDPRASTRSGGTRTTKVGNVISKGVYDEEAGNVETEDSFVTSAASCFVREFDRNNVQRSALFTEMDRGVYVNEHLHRRFTDTYIPH